MNDDQCGYLAAQYQRLIDAGQFAETTPDQREAWLVENTYDAALTPIDPNQPF